MSIKIRKAGIRLAILLLLSTLLPLGYTASAQQAKVSFKGPSLSIYDGLREISRQAGMRLVVNLSKYDYSRNVAVPSGDKSVTEALDILLAGSGQTYRIDDNHILILDKNDEASVQQLAPPAVGAQLPVPDNSEFEQSLHDYRALGLEAASRLPRTESRETVVEHTVDGPIDGVFNYPSSSQTVNLTAIDARSQETLRKLPTWALKTNLLYAGATLTPNLGVEVGLGDKGSLELMLSYNPWNLEGSYEDNKKLVHRMAKIEYRWWLCERFNGHFFGAHGLFANYNVSRYDIPLLFEKEYRYQGYAVGGGISYGYHLMLAKHWGLEFTVGAGVVYMDYDKKDCAKCGNLVGHYEKIYFGPTSLGVKLVFMIK